MIVETELIGEGSVDAPLRPDISSEAVVSWSVPDEPETGTTIRVTINEARTPESVLSDVRESYTVVES